MKPLRTIHFSFLLFVILSSFAFSSEDTLFHNCSLSMHENSNFLCLLNISVLSQLKQGDLFDSGLPQLSKTFKVVHITNNKQGWKTVSAREPNSRFQTFQITIKGKHLSGLLVDSDAHFKISCQDNLCNIRDMEDLTPVPTDSEDFLIPPQQEQARDLMPYKAHAYVEDGKIIDILLLYTHELYLENGEGINPYLTNLVEVGNQVLANSNIDLRLKVVGLIPYYDDGVSEDVDEALALDRITSSPDIQKLRTDTGADIVLLIRRYSGGNMCGIAWQMKNLSDSFSHYAYAVVDTGSYGYYYCSDYTLIHEVGHILGCDHDPEHGYGGIFPYSHGYDIPGLFATVMSYDQPHIAFFSNPRITYSGMPIGDPDTADNARTINETKIVVANFQRTKYPSMPDSNSTIDTPEEQIAQLYVGYFDRAPDLSGLSYWVKRLEKGYSLLDIAHSFAVSAEAVNIYPFLSDSTHNDPEAFISSIYKNLFFRDPDSSGLSYWMDTISHGVLTVPDMVISIIEGAKAPTGSKADKNSIENKVEIALYYVHHCLSDTHNFSDEDRELSSDLLSQVDSDPDSVSDAKLAIDDLCGSSNK